MASTIYISVDDTSPSISYFPFGDTLSTPNVTTGWNPYFSVSGFAAALGEIGSGTSYHTTAHDDASLSITWKGTGIQLVGYTVNASYEIALDGVTQQSFDTDSTNHILATFLNLTDIEHTVSLSARIPTDQNQLSGIFFDKALIISTVTTSSNLPFTEKPLDGSFTGPWSFINDSGNAFHQSSTQGDTAQTTFTGTSLVLKGKTSPNSGNYSVTLNDFKTTLSGRSSFKQDDSVLFFATGLDPEKTHNVQVVNEDGDELSLKVDGFGVYAAGPPTTSPTVSGTPSSGMTNTSRSKGTIAALVLAGILAFLIFTSILFFFFVYRPRKRRVLRARMEQRRRKVGEAIGVIDIGPTSRPDVEPGSAEASAGHRNSGRSGFAHWKREVEGGFSSLGLGIVFRHSDATSGKSQGDNDRESEPLSAKSSLFTTASKLSSKYSKGKGKKKAKSKQVSEGSWSPSFALELPVRPPSSADSYKDKDIGRSHFSPDGHLSITSELTSLSYASTPPAPAAANPAPPSYSVSSSNRNSSSTSPPLSVPRSVSHSVPSSNSQSRRGSDGLVVNYGDPNTGTLGAEQTRSHGPFASSLSPPSNPGHYLPPLVTREDVGSAKYGSDDTTSYLGSAATRLAIRGLSPRTSEYPEQHICDTPERECARRNRLPKAALGPASNENKLSTKTLSPEQRGEAMVPQPHISSFLEVRSPQDQTIDIKQQEEIRADTQTSDRSFLDVISPRPPMVDFPENTRRDGHGETSERMSQAKTNTPEERSSKQRKKSSRKLRSVFRLTPPSNPPSSTGHKHARHESTSFLDFSSSSDTSYRTQSVAPSEISGGQWIQEPRSRWSNTGTSGISDPVTSLASPPRSIFATNFPYPVSLPPSPHHPEGHIRSPTQSALPRIVPPQQPGDYTSDDDTSGIGIHPLSPIISPTDSIPISVSEVVFRHSSSTGEAHGSNTHLPPHPPLPPPPSYDRSETNTPPIPASSYIVQHVLGQTTNSSGTLTVGRIPTTLGPQDDSNKS